MIKRCVILLNLLVLSVLIRAIPVHGATNQIIIRGADETITHTGTTSQDETCPPGPGQGFIIQSANGNSYRTLVSPPDDLRTRIDNIRDRVILVRADHNRVMQIRYPVGMFEDVSAAANQ